MDSLPLRERELGVSQRERGHIQDLGHSTQHPEPSTQHSALRTQGPGLRSPLPRFAVIVAAGRGTRMGEDKVWMALGSMPVVAFSLRAFSSCPTVGRIVLVVSRDKMQKGRELVAQMGVPALVCEGGERRQDSVQNGLALLEGDGLVAIHDGARPLVTPRIIEEVYREAEDGGAAIAAVPAKDTIKRVSPEGWVKGTLDRSQLWAVQTPQVFLVDLIRRAYSALREEVTDDSAAVELLGHPVKVVVGSPLNIKLTTREDLVIADALLKNARDCY